MAGNPLPSPPPRPVGTAGAQRHLRRWPCTPLPRSCRHRPDHQKPRDDQQRHRERCVQADEHERQACREHAQCTIGSSGHPSPQGLRCPQSTDGSSSCPDVQAGGCAARLAAPSSARAASARAAAPRRSSGVAARGSAVTDVSTSSGSGRQSSAATSCVSCAATRPVSTPTTIRSVGASSSSRVSTPTTRSTGVGCVVRATRARPHSISLEGGTSERTRTI